MKITTVLFIVAVALSLIVKASAQLIAYESFTGLTLGNGIPGSGSDSFGWATTWTGSGTTDAHYQIVAPTPNLSYQIVSGALLQGGNRALQITTNPEPLASTLIATRTFAPINTTFYISLLVRIPVSGTGTDSIDVHVMSGGSTIRRFAIRPNNPVPPAGYLWSFQGATGESGSAKTISGDNAVTHLVVIEARVTGSGGGFFFTSFIDPSATYPGFPGGLADTATFFDGIGISVSSTDTGGPTTTVILDEIRVGYTWSDVVPAATLALVPSVTIEQAQKLRWQTQTGKTYQVQYSYDLAMWFNLGSTISGNNQIKEVFDSTNADAKKFYRIQVQ